MIIPLSAQLRHCRNCRTSNSLFLLAIIVFQICENSLQNIDIDSGMKTILNMPYTYDCTLLFRLCKEMYHCIESEMKQSQKQTFNKSMHTLSQYFWNCSSIWNTSISSCFHSIFFSSNVPQTNALILTSALTTTALNLPPIP